MIKYATILILAAVLIGLAWVVWFRHEEQVEEEAGPATEVPVHLGRITRSTLRGYVTAYGTVDPEPAGEHPAASARVAPAVPGVIVDVKCAEGRRVARGDVLFQLDSRAVDVAVEFAEKALERQKKLIRVDGTSQKALEEAERQLDAARVQQAWLQVRSPLAGTVIRINARPGDAVDLTTVLGEVVDLDRLVVSASVPSAELAALKSGQSADVIAGKSIPPITGSLAYIGAEVDTRNGTAPVRVALPPNSGMRPGQFVTVRIVSEEHRDCLAVPIESVVRSEDGLTVIAVVQNDTALRKPVKTGLRDGGLVEIEADGLNADMQVVTEGAYGLPEETRVRIIK
jgi:RND family efflux transporter MFP subunit